MKIIKKTGLVILSLIAIGLLFRGCLYRQIVAYHSIGVRTTYVASDPALINHLDETADYKNAQGIEYIIRSSLSITSQQLSFSTSKNDNDPNKLIYSKKAHCVGYAAFFSTTCNYFLKKYKLSKTWVAKPQIGQLFFLGYNIHKYFNSPFFKDHDFVTIENKSSGVIYAVDPTVNDYLLITYVTFKR